MQKESFLVVLISQLLVESKLEVCVLLYRSYILVKSHQIFAKSVIFFTGEVSKPGFVSVEILTDTVEGTCLSFIFFLHDLKLPTEMCYFT